MEQSKQGVRDLTQGNPFRLILAFALPILCSQVFQQLYNTADTLIVGRILGTNALAAVSSSGPLIHLLVSFVDGTAMGAGVVIARYFGAKDYDRVGKAIHTNLAFGLASGLFLTIAGLILTPKLLVWMNTDPQVLPEAIAYFRVYFSGIATVTLYNTCRGIMMAVGDSKRPLRYLIISSLLNIVLDILFVGVFGWGVWAAAFATVLSQGTSVVLCISYLLKPGRVFSVNLKKIRFHGDLIREIFRYGIPSGIQNSVIGLANVIVQSQINSFGRFAMAAFGSHNRIEGFAFLPIVSFNMAITTFVSQNLGAGEQERAKRGSRYGILSAVLMAEIVGILYYNFAHHILALFDSTPEVIALGVQQARVASLFYCLLAFSHSVAAVCRGAGKAFVPMSIMLSVWCLLRIIYIMTVMHLLGEIVYVYWAYPVTWTISSVIYLIYYLKSDWSRGFEVRGVSA